MKSKIKILHIIILSLMLTISTAIPTKVSANENYDTRNYNKLETSKVYLEQGSLILNMGLYGEVQIYDPYGEHIYTVDSRSTVYYKSKAIVPIYESGEYTFEVKETNPQADGFDWQVEYTQDMSPQENDRFNITGRNDDIIVFNSPTDQTLNIEISYDGEVNQETEYGMINQLRENGDLVGEIFYFDGNSHTLKTQIEVKQGTNILEVYLTKGDVSWNIKAYPMPMTDIEGSWAANEINDFVEKEYINGYPDNTFRPNESMTRAEFVKTFNKVFNLTATSGKTFDDSIGHWAQNEIDIAVTNGITNGISETEFGPNSPITREQAAKMLANYKQISDEDHDKLSSFADNDQVSSWARNELEAVIEHGYMKGSEGYLNPKNPIKRAEVVAMLSRVQ